MSERLTTEDLRTLPAWCDLREYETPKDLLLWAKMFNVWLESVKAEAFQEGVESHEAEAERWYFPQGQGGGTQ